MGLEIIKGSRKFGVRTNRIDPEPYFFRWESCIPLLSKDQPELIGQPCYKHKGCGHLVPSAYNRVPPRVCSWCRSDTLIESLELERMDRHGIKVFDFPQHIMTLKDITFGKIAHLFRSD